MQYKESFTEKEYTDTEGDGFKDLIETRLDTDSGLVRFGFRDYDPETGRWTTKDPILFTSGGVNLYGYCLNDPINLVDIFGLWQNWLGATLNYGGFSLGLIGFFTANPILGAFGLSLAVHGLFLTNTNYLSLVFGIGGTAIGIFGFFTGNPLLGAIGISLSIHAILFELPNPVSLPNLKSDSLCKIE